MENVGQFNAIWWVLLLPVAGFLVQALLGARVVRSAGPATGKRIMGALAVLFVAAPFAIGAWLTWQLALMPPESRMVLVHGYEWIIVFGLRIPFELVVDPLSMTMVLIITGIGALIHLYATGYMAADRDYTRFFTYLNLFVAAMLILVLGNNLVMLFIGWEGVGVCSYLLIGFWYKDLANAKAANKAFIVNRIGDWGLTLGMFLIFALLVMNRAELGDRWLSYDVMLPALLDILRANPAMATAIGLLLFVGAAGKSAQFPLYLWLPDAMAGPTPVSALIHAATMVTSGIVLLNRMHVVFEASPVASAIVASIGAFTALFAAIIAFGQTDIKKVLAYSTVSQLGFMFIGVGVGAYWTGMFHVTTHAFFKALLFLGAGAVIYAMAHNQDMRNYGMLRKYLPITFWTMVIGTVAIAGVPPLAGFWSKEMILGAAIAGEHAHIQGVMFGQIAGWVGLFVAALTAMYMTRMTVLTFFGREERWRTIPAHAHGHAHHAAGHTLEPEHHTGGAGLEESYEAHAVAIEEHPVAEDPSPKLAEGLRQDEAEEAQAGAAHPMVEHADDHHAHDDPYDFFLSVEEMHRREHEEHEDHAHHHELDREHAPREVPVSMWSPLVVLALLSAGGGWVLANHHMFERWLYPTNLPILGEVSTHPEVGPGAHLLILSLVAAGLGIVLGLGVYWRRLPESEGLDESKWARWRLWAREQFGYDRAMVVGSVEGGADLGRGIWKAVDVGIVDNVVNGLGWAANGVGATLRRFHTGYVRFYALVMLIGSVAFLLWFLLMINRLGVAG
jgi:NADH-quinone oxidoreductase subunit L